MYNLYTHTQHIHVSRYFQYNESTIQFNSIQLVFFSMCRFPPCVCRCVCVFLFECSKLIAHDGWALQFNNIFSSLLFSFFASVVLFLFSYFTFQCSLNSHFFLYFLPVFIISLCVFTGWNFRWWVRLLHFAYVIFFSFYYSEFMLCYICVWFMHTHTYSCSNNLKHRIVQTTSCPMFMHSNIYSNHLHSYLYLYIVHIISMLHRFTASLHAYIRSVYSTVRCWQQHKI